MSATLAWRLRSMLPAGGRTWARRAADATLGVLGSISGAVRPSRSLALTFDDGPEPAVTPRLLDLLAERRVRATFFVLTERANRHPGLLRRMAADGHEIALHGDRHERLTSISVRDVRRRIGAARRFLEDLLGEPVRFFRPPFGAQSVATYLAARVCGLDVVVWGPHADDWIDGTPEAVAARGLERVNCGDILLLHDGLDVPAGEPIPTFDRVRAFELLLDGLAARGLAAGSVSDLIAGGRMRRTAWFRP